MALLSPEVRGPVSQCSATVTVAGQLTGATVRVLQDDVVVGEQVAEAARVDVEVGDALQPGGELRAVQEMAGEVSEPSPVAVMVQSVTAVGAVDVGEVRACAGVLAVRGAVPGATVHVRVGTAELGKRPAPHGTAFVPLDRPLLPGESAEVVQEACGTTAATPTITMPALPALPLETPRLVPEELRPCTIWVPIHQLTVGSRVHVARTGGLGGTGFADATSVSFGLPEQLMAGEKLTVTVDQPGCDVEPISVMAEVGDPQPLDAPTPRMPCDDSRSLLVSDLVAGAEVEVFVDGVSVGRGEADRSEMRFGLPAEVKAPSDVSVMQRLCGVDARSPELRLDGLTRGGSVEIQQDTSFGIDFWPACSSAVTVRRSGGFTGELQIWTDNHGAVSDRLPAWRVFGEAARTTLGSVAIAPALADGDTVWVRYYRCGSDPFDDSPRVAVRELEELEAPLLRLPLLGGDARIEFWPTTVFGRRVQLELDGAVSSEDPREWAYVDTHRVLRAHDRLRVRTYLCGRWSSWVDLRVDALPKPSELINPLGGGHPTQPTFRWSSPHADARFHISINPGGRYETSEQVFDLPASDSLDESRSYEWQVDTRRLYRATYARDDRWGSAASGYGRFSTQSSPPPTRTVAFRFQFFPDSWVVRDVDTSSSYWGVLDPDGVVHTVPIGSPPAYTARFPIRGELAERSAAWLLDVTVRFYVYDPGRLVSGWFTETSGIFALRGPLTRGRFVSAHLSGPDANSLRLTRLTALLD